MKMFDPLPASLIFVSPLAAEAPAQSANPFALGTEAQ